MQLPRSRILAAPSRAVVLATIALLLAACGNATPTGDSPSEAPSGPATASGAPASGGAGASGQIGPCGPNDITVEATSTGGAAGSRGADVSVSAVGEATCSLPSTPMIAMLDRSGQAVLQSPIQIDNEGPVISATRRAGFQYEMSNWCSPTDSAPWTVVLATSVGTVQVSGVQYEADDLPPCNGPGQPPALTTSSWTTEAN